jgi:hypothetical protein
MFDYIKCEMPLPETGPEPGIEWFRTKDVPTGHLYLEKWRITAGGKLVKLGVRYEDRSDKTAPEGSFERIRGMMTPVLVPEDDETFDDFHGDICFGHFDTKTREDWEYVARFTDGVCTKIAGEYSAKD